MIEKCEEGITSDEETIVFDFSGCFFSDPFAITVLVGAMSACLARGKKVHYRTSPNVKLESYLGSIGFYEFGTSPVGQSKFKQRQVELQHLKAIDPTYTDAVIRVLGGYLQMFPGVKASLHLSLNELMTNTFDHSQTIVGCFVCVQGYNRRGKVSICLTDFGKGILRILSSSPKYNFLENSIESIELAVKEGVSSRTGKLAGLGLSHIHKFLEINNGEIHIISGDGWVHWNYAVPGAVQIKRKRLSIAFDGTIVNILARADGEGLYVLASENPEEVIF
ncbi:MAG: ATP-binding protein [Bacteroidota bacterium]